MARKVSIFPIFIEGKGWMLACVKGDVIYHLGKKEEEPKKVIVGTLVDNNEISLSEPLQEQTRHVNVPVFMDEVTATCALNLDVILDAFGVNFLNNAGLALIPADTKEPALIELGFQVKKEVNAFADAHPYFMPEGFPICEKYSPVVEEG